MSDTYRKNWESIFNEVDMKKQGYNSKMDESLGAKSKGPKKQSMKARRDESKGMAKSMGKKAYSSVKTMDKGMKKKKSCK